jgi:hypothetical protein
MPAVLLQEVSALPGIGRSVVTRERDRTATLFMSGALAIRLAAESAATMRVCTSGACSAPDGSDVFATLATQARNLPLAV